MMTSRMLKSSLLAAALIVLPAAAYSAEPAKDARTGSDATAQNPATQKSGAGTAQKNTGSQMQKNTAAKKSSAQTTGSGAVKDPASAPAMEPKKSLDDPKQYGKPDKH